MSEMHHEHPLDALPADSLFKTCLTSSQMTFLTTLLPHGYSFQKTRFRKISLLDPKAAQFTKESQDDVLQDINQQKVDKALMKNDQDEGRSNNIVEFSNEKHYRLLVLMKKCLKIVRSCNTAKTQFSLALKIIYDKLQRLQYPSYQFFEDDFLVVLGKIKTSNSKVVRQTGEVIEKQFLSFLGHPKTQTNEDRDSNIPSPQKIYKDSTKEPYIREKQSKVRSLALKKQSKKKKIIGFLHRRKTRAARRKFNIKIDLPTIPEESQYFSETSSDQALTFDEVRNITNLLRQLCIFDRQRLLSTLMNSQNISKLISNLRKKDASAIIERILSTFHKTSPELNDTETTETFQSSQEGDSHSI